MRGESPPPSEGLPSPASRQAAESVSFSLYFPLFPVFRDFYPYSDISISQKESTTWNGDRNVPLVQGF